MKKKEEVLEEIKQVEQSIGTEIENFRDTIWHKIKIGISIGLVAVGTFWAFRRYLDEVIEEKPTKTNDTPIEGTHLAHKDLDIVSMIKREMAMFLLLLAKKQIQELLKKIYTEQEAQSDDK
ncbi:MAG: hypothetical protein SFU27_03635 [Thermonemataceae bacterium]|nr:hypothetical protein [Thermonemataceae bacterium]